jgi:undecaprenyl diphosphate synthase
VADSAERSAASQSGLSASDESGPHPRDRGDAGPLHVAFIMDGNGRWAQQRGLPRLEGHRIGVDRIQVLLETLSAAGVKFATIYAFSTENWGRPQGEVDGLMNIFLDAVEMQTRQLHERDVRIVHLGKTANLGAGLRGAIERAQELTRNNTGITLNVAFDYGGRDEILRAVRRIVRDGLTPDQVDESTFSRYLFTAHCPDPDLIIRTGGEQRISNFLLWQSAYSEFYHTCTLWPDLEPAELEQALEAYRSRQRRYGKVADSET